MTILGKHIFHKYREIKIINSYTFFGEELTKYDNTKYRKCIECQNIQEFFWDSHGGYWLTMLHKEQDVLNKKMVLDKNEYYILELSKPNRISKPPKGQ